MPTLQPHKELFRIPTTAETVSLFRSLLDSHEITPSEALALSGSIHAELRQAKGKNGSAYAGYAQAMALLNHHLPEVHQHVVSNWYLLQEKPSAPVRSYDDSLFDDTAVMSLPGMRSVSEAGRESVKGEGEMLELAGGEEETGEMGEGGEEEGSKEEDEPDGEEESENEEENEVEAEDESGEAESESEEIRDENEEGEVEEETDDAESEINESEVDEEIEEVEYEEPEETETQELEYEDVSEGEAYDEVEMEDDETMAREAAEAVEHFDETEYEIEPRDDEENPWAAEE